MPARHPPRLRSVAALLIAASMTAVGYAHGVGDGGAEPGGVAGPLLTGDQGDGDWGLPGFDVRVDAGGVPLKAVTAKIDAARGARDGEVGVGGDARMLAVRALQARDPMLVVDDDALFGTPRFVRSTAGLLTGPSTKADGVDVVRAYVAAWPGLFEIDAKEIDLARRSRDFPTAHNGVRHLTFQQQIGGRDLFGAEVRASVTKRGELVNISSTMLPRPAEGFAVPAMKLSDAEAVLAAATNVGVRYAAYPAPAGEPDGPALKRAWAPDAGVRPEEPTTTQAVYFPLDRETVHPAWMVVIAPPGVGHTYEVVVDATDGSVLWRHDRLVWETTQPITARVFTADSPAPGSPGLPTPSATQLPAAGRVLLTVQPSDMATYSPNGWINDGATQSIGNNVDVHLDLTNANPTYGAATFGTSPAQPVVRIDGGVSRTFDFPLDLTLDPSNNRPAAMAQMFYRCNVFHDRLYALGFDEAAGNFQATNFTGRGLGGDAVQADVQDSASNTATSSNRNNANFNTGGADGTSARVQMYIFTGPTPDRDGSLEGDVVYHEMTHGVSIRLHGGITATQTAGMGEGWSDFVALSLLAEPGDDIDATYPMGPWVTYQLGSASFTSNYYFGIRKFPYTTDLAKNPSTFADIDPNQISLAGPISPIIGGAASEVHNVGAIWAQILYEARANMLRRYGYAGNERMLRLVIDGMKLSPANPTFAQARDAILQADFVDYAGADTAILWQGFAKRGLGFGAVAPASSTTTGVVESYTAPSFVRFSYPDGLPSRLTPGQAAAFRVAMEGNGLTLTDGSATLTYSVGSGAPTTVPLSANAAGELVATIPAQDCYASVKFSVGVGTSAGAKVDPPPTASQPNRTFRAFTAPAVAPIVSDDFEGATTSWTLGAGTATAGAWQRGVPFATAAAPGSNHTPGGTMCWATGLGAPGNTLGAADVDGGTTVLLSPVFDLSGRADAVVSYWRWYSNGVSTTGQYNDTFRVDVSLDGGTNWTNAETIGPGDNSDPDVQPGWRFAAWSLSSLGLTPTSQVRVRFVAEDAGAASIVEAALDDFAISPVPCSAPTPPPCRADFNGSGGPDLGDIFGFLNAWFAGDIRADYNQNAAVELTDIFAFLHDWFAGCP